MSPVPGDALPEAELPLEAAELPEGAVLETVALEVVVLGRAALAVVLPAATLAVATCGWTSQWNGSKLELGSTQDGFLAA